GNSAGPTDHMVERFRHAVTMRALTPGAFTVSFANGDRFKAQAVVLDLVQRLRAQEAQLEVLDPANLPSSPSGQSPRPVFFFAVTCGLLVGVLVITLNRGTPRPA